MFVNDNVNANDNVVPADVAVVAAVVVVGGGGGGGIPAGTPPKTESNMSRVMNTSNIKKRHIFHIQTFCSAVKEVKLGKSWQNQFFRNSRLPLEGFNTTSIVKWHDLTLQSPVILSNAFTQLALYTAAPKKTWMFARCWDGRHPNLPLPPTYSGTWIHSTLAFHLRDGRVQSSWCFNFFLRIIPKTLPHPPKMSVQKYRDTSNMICLLVTVRGRYEPK